MKFINDSFRFTILFWIKRNIAKTPEGCVNPKWLDFIYHLLFPLNRMYEKNSHTNYDFQTDTYIIEGLQISGSFIRSLSNYAKIGIKYELVENDKGVITIKTIE
jgi:hypothetical protein